MLIVYPLKVTDLETEHPLIEKAVFPGIKVGVFDVELGFDCQKIIDKAIGSPILPCIKVKEAIKSSTQIPSRDEFLHAISTTLRAVTTPEIKQNEHTLMASWAAIKDKGESQLSKDTASPQWPEYVIAPNPQKGEKVF